MDFSYQTRAEMLLRSYMHSDSFIVYSSVIAGIFACKMVYDLSQILTSIYFKGYAGLSKSQQVEWSNRSISTIHAIFITAMSLYLAFWSDLFFNDQLSGLVTLRSSTLSTFVLGERFEEIMQQQMQTQYGIDERQAYYQAAGGEKKRRVFGLGCAAQSYYGPNLRISSGSDASSAISPLNAQPTQISNLEELVTRLIPALTQNMLPSLTQSMIPALTDHMLPVFVQRIQELISLTSQQTNVVTGSPSTTTPVVDAPTTNGNADEVRSSSSDDDRNPSGSH